MVGITNPSSIDKPTGFINIIDFYRSVKAVFSNIVNSDLGTGVSSVTMISNGSGYSTPPDVSFTGGGGQDAAGTAVLGFGIQSVSVTNPGSYASIPTLGATVGSGATFSNTMKAVSVVTENSGDNYVVTDTLTAVGGTFTSAATFQVASVGLIGMTINAAGSGYTVNDIVTLVGGIITTAATVKILTVDGGGAVTSFSIQNNGEYTNNQATFTVTGGTGTGLTFNNTHYGIVSVGNLTAGSYTVLPANPVAVTGGSGTGAEFNINWGLNTVTVTAPGTNYDNTSAFTVTGGGGSGGGAGTLTLESTGSVKAVTVTNNGFGYETAPIVGFVGGGGSDAGATANIGNAPGESLVVSIQMLLPDPSLYSVKACANQAASCSIQNKTTSGFDVVLSPLNPNQTLVAGLIDITIRYGE